MSAFTRNALLIAAGVLFLLLASALYVVPQTQQVLVLQFGKVVNVVEDPGLKVKVPFVQNIERFDKRIIDFNAEPKELIAADQKRLIIDAFAKYRINDPLKFYQTVRSENGMNARLNSILDSRLREVLGTYPLTTMLTEKRPEIMGIIQTNVKEETKDFGIDVLDVRIMRADLPAANSEAIYRRMQTEREREAKEFRAQGAEEAQRITSRADRERTVLIAEAKKQSEILRGEGDAEATRIFAEAFGKDVAFFDFYRTMQAYRETLRDDNTKMVLSPDSDFLRYLTEVDRGGN